MSEYNILKRPIITEKTEMISENSNQFFFEVPVKATKTQIKNAVENIYSVKVVKINTAIYPGKLKRKGSSIGRTSKYKKAAVTLTEGQTIDFYAAE